MGVDVVIILKLFLETYGRASDLSQGRDISYAVFKMEINRRVSRNENYFVSS
jgi:hypothetical protein